MKKHKFFALALIATLLLATGSAAADSTRRTEFTGVFFNCGPTGPPEEIWTTGDGRVLHVRGEPGDGYARSDHEYYNAYMTGVTSYDLNLATGWAARTEPSPSTLKV